MPETLDGFSTRGATIRLFAGIDDDGEIYVNGMQQQVFHWDDGEMVLTRHAVPGEKYVLALRGINTIGSGQLHFVNLRFSIPILDTLSNEVSFFQMLEPNLDLKQQIEVQQDLLQSQHIFDSTPLSGLTTTQLIARLNEARQPLMPLKSITRKYQVFYVGHAHIDMNWLWTWPETIDVCKRTWASVMHLMHLFPQFCFVQSQPGAYAAIQKRFPEEFAQMQAAAKRGQWEPVSGFWDESDTDMPSGEALARSLFLGQRYFKKYFGHYAVTGWLPDSFGHSWQLPQLMQLVGINSFYHMRCGDGIRIAWWESPDGSRVLKANTDSYDEPVTLDQLVRPWHNERRYGVPKAMVVFGVGDHGGGPTRQQILQGIAYQNDPLLPRVTFSKASTYFNTLRKDNLTSGIPVVDTDLQYTFQGCYTTHADLKKAVRSCQNNLYSAEVLASLASTTGYKYPAKAFRTAWKPTAFAQFHDIMAGTAIHSTYTWMEARLTPADAWARKEREIALNALTAKVATNGQKPGEVPLVVWNALSYPRTDVVRIHVANPSKFKSVRDQQGTYYPVQDNGSDMLVFVARDVPAFGHSLYFLSDKPAPDSNLLATESDALISLQNRYDLVKIDPATGLLTGLTDLATGREFLKAGEPQNVFQLLGDKGNAWDINYTGKQVLLTSQGVSVQLIDRGPVFDTVRVIHKLGASTYTQDITLYQDIRRLDVICAVDWHEHDQMLKADINLAMPNPHFRVSIPYGSISRPDSGVENPGQDWMDMSNRSAETVANPTVVDLNSNYDNDSSVSFDTEGNSFNRSLFPAPGIQKMGRAAIPFEIHGNTPGKDNILCDGQTIKMPADYTGHSLCLMGASTPGDAYGMVTLTYVDGTVTRVPIVMNDWVMGNSSQDKSVATFASFTTGDGSPSTAQSHLWMTSIPLSNQKLQSVTLPTNASMHIFGMTIATLVPGKSEYGLTILNNCKYGSDANGSLFRLSLLRSTSSPDPTPDVGMEYFTYSLLPHTGGWRAGDAEQAGKALNIPLYGVITEEHKQAEQVPVQFTLKSEHNDLVAGALKHCESGKGYILRFFETRGEDTTATIRFNTNVRAIQCNIMESPMPGAKYMDGKDIHFQVGHDKIITLWITGLPDAGETEGNYSIRMRGSRNTSAMSAKRFPSSNRAAPITKLPITR